jgi:hypothetical protein
MIDLAIPIVGLLVSLAALAYSLLIHEAAAPVDECRFAKVIPERWRWAHRWFAHFAEYAWQPCPLCGREFGGHEWRDIDGKTSLIPNPASQWGHLGICPACTRAGRGHRRPRIFHLPDQHYHEGE